MHKNIFVWQSILIIVRELLIVFWLRNWSYGLIEIKLGGDRLIQEGADALIDLKDKIDTTKMKKPSFLMVLTAVGEETVVLDGTDGCRSVCLQTSEGWRFSGSNRLSERMNNDY